MKRKFLMVLLAIVAALCLCFGLVACGDKTDPSVTTPTEQGDAGDGSGDDGGDKGGSEDDGGDDNKTPDDGEGGQGGSEGTGGSGGQGGQEGEGGSEGTGGQEGEGGSEGTGGQGGSEGTGGQGGSEGTGGEGGEGGDDDEPCAHQYTAENVCSLCGDAWEYTEGLKYELDEETNTYSVGRYQDVSGDVVIPYGYQGKFVTKIKNGTFWYSDDIISSITIPGSIQRIEPSFIGGNNLEHIIVTEDNPNYKSENECLIEKKTNTLILGCKNSVIPNDVTAIGDYAFFGCSALTDIVIPNNVTSIGYMVFESTAYFGDPSHWDSDGVLYIDNRLIKAKPTLSGEYTVRAGTKTIAAMAFSGYYEDYDGVNCSDPTSIVIPNSVTSVGDDAFYRCKGLESITVDAGNQNYSSQDGILYNKEQTEIVQVPKAIKGKATIPNGVTKIANDTFLNCHGLTDIVIPASVTEIGDDAFRNCDGLTDITIPAGAEISGKAFRGCSGLNSITFKGTVSIKSLAFEDCTNLSAVYISDLAAWCNSYFPAAPNRCNPLAFAHHLYLDGQKVIELNIPNGITEIKAVVFNGCTDLTSVTIPNSVTSIGAYAFYGCSKLTDIQFKGTVEEWQAIEKGSYWNGGTGDYTVTCTDGTVDKYGNVTYFGN